MLVHFSHFNGLAWFKNAGACVDAFFIISGFVMSQRYRLRIGNSYGPSAFLKARLIRLAPLNFVGAVIGLAAVCVATMKSDHYHYLTEMDLLRS